MYFSFVCATHTIPHPFSTLVVIVLCLELIGCGTKRLPTDSSLSTSKQIDQPTPPMANPSDQMPPPPSSNDAEYGVQQRMMVARQMRARDIVDASILRAMEKTPRHEFVPELERAHAYEDRPLSIGHQQTISQPYIVALMTQLAEPSPEKKALDIGTGSGYQAAVLSELTKEVYSIEIICSLADSAKTRLKALGYSNVKVRCGDGYHGWKEEAPFDLIIVAAAPDHIPKALVEQLAPGGRMVIPVGTGYQSLKIIEKRSDGSSTQTDTIAVRFVPMTGDALR